MKNWFPTSRKRTDLPFILTQTPHPTAELKIRVHWCFELVDWIRRSGSLGSDPSTRMQYLLDILDANESRKFYVAQTLRSILSDTKGLELFTQTGMLRGDHLGGELWLRLIEKFPLRAPEEQELHYIFSENIRSSQDIEWLECLDHKTLARLWELFHFQVQESEKRWNNLRWDAEKALVLLSLRLQGFGLSSEIRKRVSQSDFQKLPFYDLPSTIKAFLATSSPVERRILGFEIQNRLLESLQALDDVKAHLQEHGVSISVVYKMERMECLIKRIQDILELLLHSEIKPLALSKFLESLITENISRQSLLEFVAQNFSLLARKIVERTAETGEDYIVRSVPAHLKLIKKSLGGGFITAFTTMIKFLIFQMGFGLFGSGFLAALNYSASFLWIHFAHFTLGTKQPSMTASALAAEMEGPIDEFVDEVIHLVRSQFSAILGNILGVVPTVMLLCLLYQRISGLPFLSEEKAIHTLRDLSILGPTPLYAYFTGILLWVSSVFSGWMDNFFVLHRYTSAIASHRGLQFLFGPEKSLQLAHWVRRNVLGICANVSLGFLLALSPAYFQSWGFPIEVRHVTLSSGAITAAMMSLPVDTLFSQAFGLAILGIASMGVLNVVVSFGLALLVAINARKVQAPTRHLIYKKVLLRILNHPASLFWPTSKFKYSDKKLAKTSS